MFTYFPDWSRHPQMGGHGIYLLVIYPRNSPQKLWEGATWWALLQPVWTNGWISGLYSGTPDPILWESAERPSSCDSICSARFEGTCEFSLFSLHTVFAGALFQWILSLPFGDETLSAEEHIPKCGTKLVSAGLTSAFSLESKSILWGLELRARLEGAAEDQSAWERGPSFLLLALPTDPGCYDSQLSFRVVSWRLCWNSLGAHISPLLQSLCVALPPGLAVSVLKAIFQEVHVQVSGNSHFGILPFPSPCHN